MGYGKGENLYYAIASDYDVIIGILAIIGYIIIVNHK